MFDRLTMNLNAADAIGYFDQNGIRYPHPGEDVSPEDLLNVLDTHFVRRKRLLGWVGVKNIVTRVEMVDIDAATLFLSNADDWAPLGNFIISNQPPPRVLSPHADLLFYLDHLNT